MSYTPTLWIGNSTPLSEGNMNKIENGIKEAHDQGDLVTLFLAAGTNPHETSGTVGNELNLAQGMTNFKFIIINFYAIGLKPVIIHTSSWTTGGILPIREINISATVGSTAWQLFEFELTRISDVMVKITTSGYLSFTGTDVQATRAENSAMMYIAGIFGVK